MENEKDHIPVLPKEVVEYLRIQPNDNVIDGTVGNGGHARLLLEASAPFGKLLGIDADAAQIQNARRHLHDATDRLVLMHGSYANMKEIAARARFKPINAILLDLGYSSWHMEKSGKGFSFMRDEPLDMRYGQGVLIAYEIINEYSEQQLTQIFEEYGEEKYARQIAKKIVAVRRTKKIESTFELVDIIGQVIGKKSQGGIHYATRTFQALRIAVNGELESLQKVLPEAIDLLEKGGRLAVISFHSLEDRIVKNICKEEEKLGRAVISTKKPIVASQEEVQQNPRARSAKLRVIIKN